MQSSRRCDDGSGYADPVVALCPPVQIRIDPEPLARLRAEVGPLDAADLIRRAREELIHGIDLAEVHHRDCAFDLLAADARRLMLLACETGFPELRRAAEHVHRCAAGADATALAATLARMVRLGRWAAAEIADLPPDGP